MGKVIISKVADGEIMSFNCGYDNEDEEGSMLKPDLEAIAAKHDGLDAADIQAHEWTKETPEESDFEEINISGLVADDLTLFE